MQLLNCSPKRININSLCCKIISKQIYALKYIILFRKDPNWAEDNCIGIVTSDILLELIEYVAQNPICFCILDQIVDLADGAAITDVIFKKLFQWQNLKEKEALLISLCHKKLNEKQLIALCKTQCTFECFYELGALYYTEPTFSTDLFIQFVLNFKRCKYAEQYEDLICELRSCYDASEPAKYRWVLEQAGAQELEK